MRVSSISVINVIIKQHTTIIFCHILNQIIDNDYLSHDINKYADNLRPVYFLIYLRPWWWRTAVIEAIKAGGWLDSDAVIMILGVSPGPDPPGPQSQEHRSNQLPETGRVHRVLLALTAVLQIVIIQRRPGQRHSLEENYLLLKDEKDLKSK